MVEFNAPGSLMSEGALDNIRAGFNANDIDDNSSSGGEEQHDEVKDIQYERQNNMDNGAESSESFYSLNSDARYLAGGGAQGNYSVKSESKLSGAIGLSHRSKDFSYKGGSRNHNSSRVGGGVRDSFRTADEGGSEFDDAF